MKMEKTKKTITKLKSFEERKIMQTEDLNVIIVIDKSLADWNYFF